jgi:hypothetical protein
VSKLPAEKQPQLITSEDNKIQILNHAAGGDQFGCYSIKGSIRNLSSESDINVEIKVDYYDINGVKIDTEVDTLYIPHPGGSRGFHIIYPGMRHDDVLSYKIYPFATKKR